MMQVSIPIRASTVHNDDTCAWQAVLFQQQQQQTGVDHTRYFSADAQD
jgi:hypothetical protein